MRRDTAALTLGSLATGAFAYVVFVLATQSLGSETAAPIATLWTWWSATLAILTFPIQHWIIRSLAAGREDEVASTLPRLAVVVLLLAFLATAVGWWARHDLFNQDGLLFPALAGVITIGSGVVGVARGGLAGRERFVATGVLLGAEGAVRFVGAALAALLDAGPGWFGAAVVSGGLVTLAVPSALRYESARAAAPPPSNQPLAFLSGLAGASLVAQLVLTGGPVALAAIGGAPEAVTALFCALALFRAPYVVALGVVTQVTGVFTRWHTSGRVDLLGRARLATLAVTAGTAAAAFAVGAWMGPEVVRFVFGPDVLIGTGDGGRVAAGTVVGLGNLVLTLMLVAAGRARPVVTAWAAAVTAAVMATLVLPGSEMRTVTDGFLVAEATAFVWMAGVSGARGGRPPVTPPR